MTKYLFSVIYRLQLDSQTRLDILGFSGLSATSPSGTKHFIFPPDFVELLPVEPRYYIIDQRIRRRGDDCGRGGGASISASLTESNVFHGVETDASWFANLTFLTV